VLAVIWKFAAGREVVTLGRRFRLGYAASSGNARSNSAVDTMCRLKHLTDLRRPVRMNQRSDGTVRSTDSAA
jgi:hypothetical protein